METLTYPGVYIEELPSAVHTITGEATSIASFVGWAPKGPTDEAVLVQSFPEFERQFGGLDSRSLLGYSVSQFFTNGGTHAYIVRLADAATAASAHVAVPGSSGNAFTVTAISPGQWANTVYGVRIVQKPGDPTRISLLVVFTPTGGSESVVESFVDLSMSSPDPQSRTVDSVVNDKRTGSQLIRISSVSASSQRTANPLGSGSPYMLTGGNDGTVFNPNDAAFNTALHAGPSDAGGVHQLDNVSIFNLLCVPGETNAATIGLLQAHCRTKRAF